MIISKKFFDILPSFCPFYNDFIILCAYNKSFTSSPI